MHAALIDAAGGDDPQRASAVILDEMQMSYDMHKKILLTAPQFIRKAASFRIYRGKTVVNMIIKSGANGATSPLLSPSKLHPSICSTWLEAQAQRNPQWKPKEESKKRLKQECGILEIQQKLVIIFVHASR